MSIEQDGGVDEAPGHPSGLSTEAMVRRVQSFDSVFYDRIAEQVTDLPFGVARLTPELPRVYSINGVEVTKPAALSEVLRATEVVMTTAEMRHRLVFTSVPEVAWTLGPGLTDRGWSMSRTVYMVHDGVTEPLVSPLGFDLVDIERWTAVSAAFTADNEWGRSAPVQADMVGRDRRVAERIDTTFVLSSNGQAGCHVYRGAGTAQIEQVHVLSEARGHGHGTGLLAKALQVAANERLTFLIADADDWPRQWYERWGFVAVASAWEWLRLPTE
ncbi:GNAT family N-acetyltransferase [Euzebya tangerina]|uniref:GNAT family N-acetyltransferase n=1 Tax=Euzebya tangerina TaxID=591198 RepID=UPI0013C34B73|nr:GNAT family N-acetyltransferase [Euzebya tangerina]